MDSTLEARAKTAVNPFDSNRVDSAWDPDSVDVEAINRIAFERCRETIELVRTNGQCRGLLLAGEPGSGKTHLLQRLRRHVQRRNEDCFVYVPPVSGPDRFFRDLLLHTVHDFVVGRTASPVSQLESVLVRALLRAETRQRVTAAEFWSDLRSRHAPGEALFRHLDAAFQRLSQRLHLDPDTAVVTNLAALGKKLESAFAEFGSPIELEGAPTLGPAFIRFLAKPRRGVSVRALTRLGESVWMRLGTTEPPQVHLERGRIAIDVERPDRMSVAFGDWRHALPARERVGCARFAVGVTVDGSCTSPIFQNPKARTSSSPAPAAAARASGCAPRSRRCLVQTQSKHSSWH